MNMEKRLTDKDEKILKLLKEGSKTYDELRNGIGVSVDIRSNISKLMNTGKMRIVGISPECNVFSQKKIVFELIVESRYDPSSIREIIMKFIEGWGNRSDLLKELEYLIDRKIRDLELEDDSKWDALLNKVIIRRPTEIEMSERMIWRDAKKLKAENNGKLDGKSYHEFRKLRSNEYLNNESMNRKLKEEVKKSWIGEINDNFFYPEKYFFTGDVDEKQVLAKFGIFHPVKMDPFEKKELIQHMIFYIEEKSFNIIFETEETAPTSFNKDIRNLSLGLSDTNNSNKYFKKFVEKIKMKYLT